MKKTNVTWKVESDVLFKETLFVCELPPVGRRIVHWNVEFEVVRVRDTFKEQPDVEIDQETEVFLMKV